ncbi:MAG: efflux RND transporter periplasmic adaptor subunit [Colwellia sp.]
MLNTKKLAYVVSAMFFVLTTGYVFGSDSERNISLIQESIIRPVKTVIVKTNKGLFERKFPGKVRSGKRVNLAFSVSGVIESLKANEGARVKKGTVVARLDPRDYRYRLNSAKANYDQSKNELGRLRYLLDKKLISRALFDQQDAVNVIALANFDSSKKALSDTVLRVPFDGVITKRYLENGEHIQADQTIASLQDISDIEIVIQVPEKFIADKRYLKNAIFAVQLNVDHSHWLSARVIEHRTESSISTNTYDVVVAIKPIEGFSIYPGMTAQVKVSYSDLTSFKAKSVQIPSDSVLFDAAGHAFVWIIPKEGGKPEKRMVTLVDYHSDNIIVSHGLNAGELVAISGLHAINEKQLLRPMLAGKEGLAG